jgi:broad specificity phosphatase PhoE
LQPDDGEMSLRTTAILIRHAHTDVVGRRLVGRLPGVHLSAEGRAQADRLRANLRTPLAAVYSSPLERARETAAPLAADRNLQVEVCAELNEIDFGEWTGLTFDDLSRRPAWHAFNTRRSSADIPGGERPAAAQARVVACLNTLQNRHRGATFAAISHADVIRSAVLCYASIGLDSFHLIDIDPASVSIVDFTGGVPRLRLVNGGKPDEWLAALDMTDVIRSIDQPV